MASRCPRGCLRRIWRHSNEAISFWGVCPRRRRRRRAEAVDQGAYPDPTSPCKSSTTTWRDAPGSATRSPTSRSTTTCAVPAGCSTRGSGWSSSGRRTSTPSGGPWLSAGPRTSRACTRAATAERERSLEELVAYAVEAATRRYLAHEVGHALISMGNPNPYDPDEEAGADYSRGSSMQPAGAAARSGRYLLLDRMYGPLVRPPESDRARRSVRRRIQRAEARVVSSLRTARPGAWRREPRRFRDIGDDPGAQPAGAARPCPTPADGATACSPAPTTTAATRRSHHSQRAGRGCRGPRRGRARREIPWVRSRTKLFMLVHRHEPPPSCVGADDSSAARHGWSGSVGRAGAAAYAAVWMSFADPKHDLPGAGPRAAHASSGEAARCCPGATDGKIAAQAIPGRPSVSSTAGTPRGWRGRRPSWKRSTRSCGCDRAGEPTLELRTWYRRAVGVVPSGQAESPRPHRAFHGTVICSNNPPNHAIAGACRVAP